MPVSVPKKSGVHRAACLSLYRALLRVTAHQPHAHQPGIQILIQGRFRRDAYLQSPSSIKEALETGYTSLQLLADSSKLNGTAIHMLKSTIAAATAPVKPPLPKKSGPRVWAHPDAPKLLESRPLPRASLPEGKKRHVPTLISAAGLPMLRFKKPQPAYLSRVIRNKQVQRNKRLTNIQRMQLESETAEMEDQWDRNLAWEVRKEEYQAAERDHTRTAEDRPIADPYMDKERQSVDDSLARDGVKWQDALQEEIKATYKRVDVTLKRETQVARRMWEIVKQEKALKAKEEGTEAVLAEEDKRKRRWGRRLRLRSAKTSQSATVNKIHAS